MKKRDLFSSVMHHSRKSAESGSAELFLFAWTIDGKTVISSSRTNPFPANQPEAKRELGISGRGVAKPIDPVVFARYEQQSRDYCYSPLLEAAVAELSTKKDVAA